MAVGKTNTILSLVSDKYMLQNPHFFYKEVVYFPNEAEYLSHKPFINFNDILVDQIDIRLIEQDVDDDLSGSAACFFFKS